MTRIGQCPRLCIPEMIRQSPLMKKGGFDVFEGLLDKDGLARIRSEALACSATAQPSDVRRSDGEETRGGSPARRFLSATGGPIQASFYQAEWVRTLLQDVSGLSVAPTGAMGTYTYYARSGDYLTIHRDIETCDVAVISCLYDGQAVRNGGGKLCLYPRRLEEPLSTIRATPHHGVVGLQLMPGQTLVLLGGIVPHAVLPVTEGQVRIVSVLCYRALFREEGAHDACG